MGVFLDIAFLHVCIFVAMGFDPDDCTHLFARVRAHGVAVPVGNRRESFGRPARGVLAEGARSKVVQPQDHEPVDAKVFPVPRSVRSREMRGVNSQIIILFGLIL